MSEQDVTQIRVDGSTVGIMGLKAVMEHMAPDYADRPDSETSAEMLKRLAEKNYIPDKVKDNYAKAFLREFRKFLGQPFEEDLAGGIQIKVLGPGCAQCDGLERELMAVMAEKGIVADLEHVRDITEIGEYGVMGSPALIINGKVKSIGSIPSRARLIQWLEEANRK